MTKDEIFNKIDDIYCEHDGGAIHLSDELSERLKEIIEQAFTIPVVSKNVAKEYCKVCGQELTEIRGRFPNEPRRKICACCILEKIEWEHEQKTQTASKSNE